LYLKYQNTPLRHSRGHDQAAKIVRFNMPIGALEYDIIPFIWSRRSELMPLWPTAEVNLTCGPERQ